MRLKYYPVLENVYQVGIDILFRFGRLPSMAGLSWSRYSDMDSSMCNSCDLTGWFHSGRPSMLQNK